MLLKVRLLQDVPALDAEKGDVVEASQHEADFWVRTGSAELVDELVEEAEVEVDEEPKSGDESADEGEDEAAPEETDEGDEELDEELDGIAVEE